MPSGNVLSLDPLAWRPWRLGGWLLVIEPPRTPRGRFSIAHQRKIKNLKKILKNEKGFLCQELVRLVFEKKAPSHWHTALLRYRQFLSFSPTDPTDLTDLLDPSDRTDQSDLLSVFRPCGLRAICLRQAYFVWFVVKK